MKTWLVRLLAALVIVCGLAASNHGRPPGKFHRHLHFTFSNPKPGQIDAIFAKASSKSSRPDAIILRENNAHGDGLSISVFAHRWAGAQEVQSVLSDQITRQAAQEKLAITSSSKGDGGYEPSRYQASDKLRFIASGVAITFGLAMMVLSLRVFGGGRLESQPQ